MKVWGMLVPELPWQYLSVSVSLCFNSQFSMWAWVSRYQNVSILDFIGAKGDEGGEW